MQHARHLLRQAHVFRAAPSRALAQINFQPLRGMNILWPHRPWQNAHGNRVGSNFFALGGKMDVTINHGECQPREKQKQSADVMFGHMTKEADHGTRMGIGRWERIPP